MSIRAEPSPPITIHLPTRLSVRPHHTSALQAHLCGYLCGAPLATPPANGQRVFAAHAGRSLAHCESASQFDELVFTFVAGPPCGS